MKYTRDTLFYIRYNSSITEEVWEQIKDKFSVLGYKQYNHCKLGLRYLDFRYNSFIRTNTEKNKRNIWCIDNNKQKSLTEITVEEFLNINMEPVYELY